MLKTWVKQATMQDSATQTVAKKLCTIILALFSSLTKRHADWLYWKSHSMTVCTCCDTEEKILRQNAFAYKKWSISHW